MAKIKFETGQTVDFDGIPTPEDVEEVAQILKIQAPKKEDKKVAEQPKKSIGRKVFDFITGSEQGVAKTIGAIRPTFTSKEATSMAQSSDELIKQAKKLPVGDPRRKQLLEAANQITSTGQGQAQQKLGEIPGQFEAGLDLAFTGLDIVSGGTFGKAAKGMQTGKLAIGKPGVVKGTEKIGEKVTEKLSERATVKTNSKIIEIVSPKLTAKEAADQAARLGTTKGKFGKIGLKTTKQTQDIADTVQKFVPDFNPSKTISENLNTTKQTVGELADGLKQAVIESGQDKIYTFKELASKMDKIVEPISLRGTPFAKQVAPIKKAALLIAKEQGGKVSNLFDARKIFDDLVNATYPNLYDNTHSPIRPVITAIRNTMNDFIADNVQDVAFKESLKIQSKLLRAVDNMSEKIASGEAKELGTTAFKRFATKYPTLKRILIDAGVVGAGVAGWKTLTED